MRLRIGCFEAIKKVAKPAEGQLHFVDVVTVGSRYG